RGHELLEVEVILLQRRIEVGTIDGRRESRPQQGHPWSEIKGGSDDRQVVDRIVAAIDSQFTGVVDEDSGQQDLQRYNVSWTASRQVPHQRTLEQLQSSDCQQGQLLVPFQPRWQ